MKPLSLTLFSNLFLLSPLACHATDQGRLSSEISDPVAIARTINIDNVYREFEMNGKRYYAGFRIDADGINHPLLVEVDRSGEKLNSWGFDDIITDIFIYRALVSVVLDNGQNFSLEKGAWVQNPEDLAQNARVVFSDGARHLIVCSPSSVFKANTHSAGCASYNPDWQVSFPWHDIEPKVCGNFLHAVTWAAPESQRLKVELATGKIIQRTPFTGKDICTP